MKHTKFKKLYALLCCCMAAIMGLSSLFACAKGDAAGGSGNDNSSDGNGEIVGGGTSGGNSSEGNSLITVDDTTFNGYNFEQMTATNTSVTYENVSMDSELMQKYGVSGEGCQAPITIASSSDGDLMLYGTDVAGTYKSTDHGKTWVSANKGLKSVGNLMLAIDPKNSDHVVNLSYGGYINLSFDGATTWETQRNVYAVSGSGDTVTWKSAFKFNGHRYFWEGLAIDPSSYDETLRYCTDVYLSLPNYRDTYTRTNPASVSSRYEVSDRTLGLYKSTDGGKTFVKISTEETDEQLSDGIVKITDDGRVFVGNQYGLFEIDKSTDEITATYLSESYKDGYVEKTTNGETTSSLLYVAANSGITGLDVVNDTIYAQTWEGIYTIADGEVNKITGDSYHSSNWAQFLQVSPSNPLHMVYQYRSSVTNAYLNDTAVSWDGGKTWTTASCNSLISFSGSTWLAREKVYIIDPSDDNRVITFGNDNLVYSDDGGETFISASGISNMLVGGRFNFNYYDSDLMMFCAQDYTGAISYNGGKSWRKLTVQDKNGKSIRGLHLYGGFASDRNTIYGFNSSDWGGPYYLVVSHDGGYTWTDTGLQCTGLQGSRAAFSSLQSYNDPDVLFAGNYYSKDNGYTWKKMDGCVAVYTINYGGTHELYGTNEEGNVVVSYDDGDTWEKITTSFMRTADNTKSEFIVDLAYDHVNNYLYILNKTYYVTGSKSDVTYTYIYKMNLSDGTYKALSPLNDSFGYANVSSIAVDPNCTDVVYITRGGSYFQSSTAIQRSIDGGETFYSLTDSTDETYPSLAANSGGYEAGWVRVIPSTGEVVIACGCYGIQKFNPPYDNSQLNSAINMTHTIKYVYDGKVVNTVTVKNNNEHNYIYDEDGLTFVGWYKDEDYTVEFANGERVFASMVLYAKMRASEQISFYDGDNVVKVVDIDDIALIYQNMPEVERDGYIFAGWYTDTTFSEQVNFKNLTETCSVYAGFYKATENLFDVESNDNAVAINYSDHKIQYNNFVDNDADVSNRSIEISVDGNSTYFITFTMDTRFRIGLTDSRQFWQYNVVPVYIEDEDDTNGVTPVGKQVYKTITTDAKIRKMLIYYWSSTSPTDFMDVKSTFKIYKLTDATIYA